MAIPKPKKAKYPKKPGWRKGSKATKENLESYEKRIKEWEERKKRIDEDHKKANAVYERTVKALK